MILDDIRDAIVGADREAVESLLNAEDLDLNAFSVNALLGMCVLAAAQSQSRNESRHQLEIGRLLVARGARADGPLGNERLLQSPLVMPITSLNDSDEIVAYYDGGSIRAYQDPTPGGRESESGRVRPGARPVALWPTA